MLILQRLVLSACFFLISFLSATLSAQDRQNNQDSIYVPADISQWIEWVKQSNPQWQCAWNNNLYECTWPGILRYSLNEQGADFTILIEMLNEGLVPLPSSVGIYPKLISVKRNNNENVAASLSLDNGQLWIKLPKGKLEIKGSFNWNQIPPELPAPSVYGLVDVEIPNQKEELKVRRAQDSLWLEKKEETTNSDSLNLSVMRRLSDGSPLSIETLIRIRVSGNSRQITIPAVLPKGSEAVSIVSPLPAQLSSEGNLALQLLPGEHEIVILSLMQQPVQSIQIPVVNLADWPKEEVWSWQADMAFRSVELSGGQPLHADLTQLPEDWKTGAIYVFENGNTLSLNETRRGEQSKAPNSINLARQFWIDLDGSGATVLDKFSGRLNDNFRINAQPGTLVGRASVDGESALVTLDPKTGASGVELRNQALNMEVVSRVKDAREFDASGWDLMADQLSISYNLPPSWKLFHVSGAAKAYGSWVDSWTLLSIFITILLVLASYKIFGKVVAIILAASLVLNHNEFLSPQMLYVHIMLLATWKTLTDNKESIWKTLSQTLLVVTFCAWALQSLAFAKLQLTQLLFPQLQAGTRYRTIIQELVAMLEGSLLVWPILLGLLALAFLALRSIFKSGSIWKAIFRIVVYGVGFIFLISMLTMFRFGVSRSYYADNQTYQAPQEMSAYNDYDGSGSLPENSVPYQSRLLRKGLSAKVESSDSNNSTFSYQGKNLLSGPALPSWKWRSFPIQLANPVSSEHKLKFYFISPTQERVISALRVVLSLLLIALIFKALGFSLGRIKNIASVAPGLAGLMLSVLILAPQANVYAEIPSQEILSDLKSRLEQKICSKEKCTVIENVKLTAVAEDFKFSLIASSDGVSSLKLPGPLNVFSPVRVKLNSEETIAMRRSTDGYLEIKTVPGRNLIEVEGKLPDPQAFTIQFADKPLVVNVDAPDWYIEGLNPSGIVDTNLRFIKRSNEDKGNDIAVNPVIEGISTWVKVNRNIVVGEQISVTTNVERVGNFNREAHVKIPLMSAERVTSGTVNIENGDLVVSFPAGVQSQSFSSVIPFANEIILESKQRAKIADQWTVSCQPILSCEFAGISPLNSTINDAQAYQWLPFPGEKVTLKISVLGGLKGDFVTVDNLTHDIRWGTTLQEATVQATVRATQQTTFKINAPENVTVKEVKLNGVSGQSSSNGKETSILLSPGTHQIEYAYYRSWFPQFKEVSPLLELSAASNNINVNVYPSQDRWILWTGGIAWGPCVVFWSKMFIVILLCIALVKLELIPGSIFGAVLLGIGVTTLPLWALIVPLGWLASIKLIPTLGSKLMFLPKVVRSTGFLLFTLIALSVWYEIVKTGLVFSPPMLIAGNGSTAYTLKWYVDHASNTLPTTYVVSLPIWCWRVFALFWSTWLVIALFNWLKSCVSIARSSFISAN